MRVGHVGVRMPGRFVLVPVTVCASDWRIVLMIVVAINMAVRMLVQKRLVLVLMLVRLGKVKQNAKQHQQATCCHHDRGRTVAQRKCEQSTDKRGKSKH